MLLGKDGSHLSPVCERVDEIGPAAGTMYGVQFIHGIGIFHVIVVPECEHVARLLSGKIDNRSINRLINQAIINQIGDR